MNDAAVAGVGAEDEELAGAHRHRSRRGAQRRLLLRQRPALEGGAHHVVVDEPETLRPLDVIERHPQAELRERMADVRVDVKRLARGGVAGRDAARVGLILHRDVAGDAAEDGDVDAEGAHAIGVLAERLCECLLQQMAGAAQAMKLERRVIEGEGAHAGGDVVDERTKIAVPQQARA